MSANPRITNRAVENALRSAQDTLIHYFGKAGVDTSEPDVRVEIRGIVTDIFEAARTQAMDDYQERLT